MKAVRVLFLLTLGWGSGCALATPIVFSAAGADATAIQSTVVSFRAALGALNPNVVGSLVTGRREINWDGVPNALAAPNNLPGDFFNSNSPRGVSMTTPGTGFQVSANAGVAPIEFDNINASYSALFQPFSAQRLFTALGSTITDVRFFVPGSSDAALTNAFGAVFSDVDLANTSSLEFFDVADDSLGLFFVPNTGGNETLSFLGIQFDQGKVVSHVRITSGNQILAGGNTANDLVVMDDFIYGEPVRVPEPGSVWLLSVAGFAAWGVRARAAKAGRATA